MQNNSETFTKEERENLLWEIIFMEGPKIDNMIGLYGHLTREKSVVVSEIIHSNDPEFKRDLFKQLDDINLTLTTAENYISKELNVLRN